MQDKTIRALVIGEAGAGKSDFVKKATQLDSASYVSYTVESSHSALRKGIIVPIPEINHIYLLYSPHKKSTVTYLNDRLVKIREAYPYVNITLLQTGVRSQGFFSTPPAPASNDELTELEHKNGFHPTIDISSNNHTDLQAEQEKFHRAVNVAHQDYTKELDAKRSASMAALKREHKRITNLLEDQDPRFIDRLLALDHEVRDKAAVRWTAGDNAGNELMMHQSAWLVYEGRKLLEPDDLEKFKVIAENPESACLLLELCSKERPDITFGDFLAADINLADFKAMLEKSTESLTNEDASELAQHFQSGSALSFS